MIRLSQTYIDLQELLIKPRERVNFILKFVLIASIGNLAIFYFCRSAINLFERENNLLSSIFGGLIVVFIVGLFVGTCSGILQRLTLLKYLKREWIIASAISGIYFGVKILRSSLNTMIVLYSIQNTTDLSWVSILGLVLAILSIALLILQGVVQKFSFKTNIKEANWLIYLPLIAAYFSGFQYLAIAIILWFIFRKNIKTTKQIICYLLAVKSIDLIMFLPIILNWLPISNQLRVTSVSFIYQIYQWLAFPDFGYIQNIYTSFYSIISSILIFSTIQGVGICLLHRKYPEKFFSLDKSSIFALTTDLNSYANVQSTIKKINSRINSLWQGDFNSPFDLIYWLAVRLDGSVIAYHPINQVSKDNFINTPLDLLKEDLVQPSNINLEKTAKLQITFSPPGAMRVNSLSGIPFSLLVVCTYIILIAVSLILTLSLEKIF
ncbi:hypothetical protein [Pleurocapsa sp. PCC 7319]|uniref:hypothetical protein n=1 Tax=Pleurocapsa sp. PCC 7319 TaxID=118161 RepID=UPI0003796C47|nr:hypothetical protein [Pleurocapsa sp. PCC 7319]